MTREARRSRVSVAGERSGARGAVAWRGWEPPSADLLSVMAISTTGLLVRWDRLASLWCLVLRCEPAAARYLVWVPRLRGRGELLLLPVLELWSRLRRCFLSIAGR